jgi:hypothetical protein
MVIFRNLEAVLEARRPRAGRRPGVALHTPAALAGPIAPSCETPTPALSAAPRPRVPATHM